MKRQNIAQQKHPTASVSQGPVLPQETNLPKAQSVSSQTCAVEGHFPNDLPQNVSGGVLSKVALIPYRAKQKQKSTNEGLV